MKSGFGFMGILDKHRFSRRSACWVKSHSECLTLNPHDLTDLGVALDSSSLIVLGELSEEKLDELTLGESLKIWLLLGAGSLKTHRLVLDWVDRDGS